MGHHDMVHLTTNLLYDAALVPNVGVEYVFIDHVIYITKNSFAGGNGGRDAGTAPFPTQSFVQPAEPVPARGWLRVLTQ